MQTDELKQCITLRKYIDDDIPFLKKIYASTRESELAICNFTTEQKKAFLDQQFMAQYTHYTKHYCTDSFDMIEFKGEVVGRFFVDYWTKEIRIVDIALAPKFQRRGIATFLFERVFKQGIASGRNVTIHVEQNNPAKALYERLGFSLKTKTNEVYLLMEWQHATAA